MTEPAEKPRRGLRRLRLANARERFLRRPPFDLKKALFILPNAFTASSIFCGLYAVMMATKPDGGSDAFYQAALAIFYAGFFDLFDGRVARLTRTQSDFGVQMDSLADAISFGVAPSVLVYRWALMDLGFAGKVVAFVFCACGVIRLARFNVLAQRGEGSPDYFLGLPIPVSAAMLVSLVVMHHKSLATPVQAKGSVVALTLVLSYLMVSNVRYFTFKSYRPELRHVPLMIIGALLAVLVTVAVHVSAVLVGGLGCYIFYGMLAEVIFFKHRKVNDPIKGHQKSHDKKAQDPNPIEASAKDTAIKETPVASPS
jgi:CDP-diacylglycerol---serine O-phosphatidyltransferase